MPRRRTYRTRKYRPPPPRILAIGALALLVPFAGLLWLANRPGPVRAPLPAMAPHVLAQAVAQPGRLVYRYSVIPGGVRSSAELASVLRRDPVLAAHYAGFDVAAAHLVRVDKPRFVHVSYRVGNKIYWTKKKVLLAAGEYLLSDGTHLVRARCGNRIADGAQDPVLEDEPAPQVLDQAYTSADVLVDGPEDGTDGLPDLVSTTTDTPNPQPTPDGPPPNFHPDRPNGPSTPPPRQWNPPPPGPIPHTPPPQYHAVVVDSTPPTPLPEPGSAALVGVALAALALARRATRRKPRA